MIDDSSAGFVTRVYTCQYKLYLHSLNVNSCAYKVYHGNDVVIASRPLKRKCAKHGISKTSERMDCFSCAER